MIAQPDFPPAVNDPSRCGYCLAPLTTRYYHTVALESNCWHDMCPACAAVLGSGTGPGRGRLYTREAPDQPWQHTDEPYQLAARLREPTFTRRLITRIRDTFDWSISQ